jgi:peptidoglycan-associated lipoprotein
MNLKSSILLVVAFGAGCSHATAAKPATSSPLAMASQSRTLQPASRPQAAATAPDTQPATSTGTGNAIYFDFDSATLEAGARPTLQKLGNQLRHSRRNVRIEGNCDERGTTEYNLALGDKRAWAAKQYLERLGIEDRRISVVSYGSERPKYPGHDETAWAKNRRDDFRVQ